MGKLLARASEDQLQCLFHKEQDLNLKIEIIKAIGRLGQGKSIDLLETIFKDKNSVLVLRKHAYRSLIAQKPYSASCLRKLDNEVESDDDKLIRYINHPMVHYF